MGTSASPPVPGASPPFASSPVGYLHLTMAALVFLALLGSASAFVVPHPVLQTYRSQDELGGYQFGSSGGPSSRVEVRDHLGVVRGAYNTIDGDGNVHRFQYISDALGYRLLSGNPFPETAVVLEAPVPVDETAEVVAARADFDAAFTAAKERSEAAAAAAVAALEEAATAAPVEAAPAEAAAEEAAPAAEEAAPVVEEAAPKEEAAAPAAAAEAPVEETPAEEPPAETAV